MQFANKFASWTAVAALGAASVFAATTTAPAAREHWQSQGRFARFMESYLNLTPQQRTQDRTIFQDARQQSSQVRHQLMQTRQSLRAAIKADDMNMIKQLSATEGNEIGQMTAIRSSAMAKAYQNLNPEQKQKVAELERAHQAAREHGRPGAGENGVNATR
jgi:Spy/CpxP family protein refolding chaperone